MMKHFIMYNLHQELLEGVMVGVGTISLTYN